MPIIERTARDCFNVFVGHVRGLVAATISPTYPLELNLSAMLREQIIAERARLAKLAGSRDGMIDQEVKATDGHGDPVLLRFTGKLEYGDGVDIYLLDTGSVVLVFNEGGYDQFDDIDDFGDFVNDRNRRILGRDVETALSEAAESLGCTRVVDLS
jgi:hypothetical protein